MIAGQETTFFGYPRGLNGKCAVDAPDAKEMIKKATNVRTCTKTMTLKAKGAGIAPEVHSPVGVSSSFHEPHAGWT